jgi:hypothetical protein
MPNFVNIYINYFISRPYSTTIGNDHLSHDGMGQATVLHQQNVTLVNPPFDSIRSLLYYLFIYTSVMFVVICKKSIFREGKKGRNFSFEAYKLFHSNL